MLMAWIGVFFSLNRLELASYIILQWKERCIFNLYKNLVVLCCHFDPPAGGRRFSDRSREITPVDGHGLILSILAAVVK
jgi:hypothetical protein